MIGLRSSNILDVDCLGLLNLARLLGASSGSCGITDLQLHVSDRRDDSCDVHFELWCEFGELAGDSELDYEDVAEMEEYYLSPESCGGTINQLIYDAIAVKGKNEESGLRSGYTLGQLYYIVPPKDPYNVPDKDRKVFDTEEEALAQLRKIKRRKLKRKAA